MLGAAASFATFSVAVKLVCTGIPLFEIVFFRGFIAFLLLAAWEGLRHGRLSPAGKPRDLIIRSLLGFGALCTYVWALSHIDLALASALNQSSPLFVALFAFLVLGEHPHPALPFLVVLGFAGAALIVSPDLGTVDSHALVGLASAMMAGLAYVWVRKLRITDRPQTIVRWFSGIVALLAFPVVLVQGFVMPDLEEALLLLAVGLLSLSGQLFLTNAYRVGRAALVSPFLYASVLANFIVGWVVWREWPTPGALAGATILVASSLGVACLAGRQQTRE